MGDKADLPPPEVYDGITAEVRRILAEFSGVPVEKIQLGTCLGQEAKPNEWDPDGKSDPLALDSLDLISVAIALEERFDIELPDKDVDDPALSVVLGLVDHVARKVAAKGGVESAQRAANRAYRETVDRVAPPPTPDPALAPGGPYPADGGGVWGAPAGKRPTHGGYPEPKRDWRRPRRLILDPDDAPAGLARS